MLKNREIRAILMDWDDTAVMTHKMIFLLYQSFSQLHNLRTPAIEDMKRLWGSPLAKIVAGLWPEEEPVELVSRFLVAGTDSVSEPFPWLVNTVTTLAAADYKLGVVSSTPRNGVQKTQAKYNLDLTVFSFFQTGEDNPFHKPDPRVFDAALASLGVTEAETLYVGDSLGDAQAAIARGLMFVAVTTGFTDCDSFIAEGIDSNLILDNLSQLPALLNLSGHSP